MSNQSLLLVADTLLFKYRNKYYTKGIYNSDFWKRYLDVFDELIVLTQVEIIDINEEEYSLSSLEKVKFIELDRYRGFSYLKLFRDLRLKQKNINGLNYAIVRLPSIVGFIFLFSLKSKNLNYFLEIVADPTTAYANRPIFAMLFSILLKKEVKKASGVSFVTKYALQKSYPPKKSAVTEHYSTLAIDFMKFGSSKIYDNNSQIINLLHVSNVIGNNLKGHNVFIKTIGLLLKNGIPAQGVIVGDGPYLAKIRKRVIKENLIGKITFVGYVSDFSLLREIYYSSDIFLFPSKAEGLPRVLIEAMSTGLVCFSSNVGGIAELLPKSQISSKNSPIDYYEKIKRVAFDPVLMNELSTNQLNIVSKYSNTILQKRRNEFYGALRKL
jgi:glycosyltransferase involved in cell wall biosynthesis